MTLHVKIISPEQKVYDGVAEQVTAPTTTGEITILPNHIPLVSVLDHGEIILKNGSKTEYIAVAGGFLDVSHNEISILADYAINSEHISAIKAEEAKKKSRKTNGRKNIGT